MIPNTNIRMDNWHEILFPDLVHLYRIRFRCIADPKRLIWASIKSFVYLWLFLTLLFLSGNCYFYYEKWDLCSLPMAKISAKVMNMERECEKVKANEEILPIVMEEKALKPLIDEIIVIFAFSAFGVIGNLMDDYYLTHQSAYALACVWCHSYYQNRTRIFRIEAYLYNAAQLCLFLAFCTMFGYGVTLHNNFHRRSEELQSFTSTTTDGVKSVTTFVTYIVVNEKPLLTDIRIK